MLERHSLNGNANNFLRDSPPLEQENRRFGRAGIPTLAEQCEIPGVRETFSIFGLPTPAIEGNTSPCGEQFSCTKYTFKKILTRLFFSFFFRILFLVMLTCVWTFAHLLYNRC